jgi:hypothetical protein
LTLVQQLTHLFPHLQQFHRVQRLDHQQLQKLAKIKAMLRSDRGEVPAKELLAISRAIKLITDDMWENDQKLDTSDKGVSEAGW